LVFLDGILKALSCYGALAANGLGLFDLIDCWTGVSHREKQLRVFV
jgi:hypothetical protein